MARLVLLTLLIGLLAACGPRRHEIRAAVEAAAPLQGQQSDCDAADACAIASPWRMLAQADAVNGRNHLLLLERGEDALLARIHLLRAAQRSIDIQTFLFARDDVGYLVLEELLAAARRGVRVRVLLDQLYSVEDSDLTARLATAHANLEIRFYNPTFGQAETQPVEFLFGALCCFGRFSQRMHNKLILVDGVMVVTGGRNFQNRYFDWDPEFNFRDRDVLALGAVGAETQASFEQFWASPKSIPAVALRDVQGKLAPAQEDPLAAGDFKTTVAQRMLEISAQADQGDLISQRFGDRLIAATEVRYLSDPPGKALRKPSDIDLSARLLELLGEARQRILLQTPYLVISPAARELFETLHQRENPPRVIVSTNSLASTDAFPVYAISHKYKRRYLRSFGFNIYEYRPHPGAVPVGGIAAGHKSEAPSVAGEGTLISPDNLLGGFAEGATRISMHAKSFVIDRNVAMVGSHNFDPRSVRYNTESALLSFEPAFADRLADSILADTAPANAWAIGRRPRLPVLSGLNYNVERIFQELPLLDFWPWRYATSFELKAGCGPLPADDPGFSACYEAVGDFPEVSLDPKAIYTRILTAFGAVLAPIM